MPTIYVCNLKSIDYFDPDEIRVAVTESNFHTLCSQYGLDPALIKPVKAHLEIRTTSESAVPFFTLHYKLANEPPIVVTRWREGERFAELRHLCESSVPQSASQHLNRTQEIFTIEISHRQCRDLGLLLAYELARWAAHKGKGLVYGLDGVWYRLTPHKAFLPIE